MECGCSCWAFFLRSLFQRGTMSATTTFWRMRWLYPSILQYTVQSTGNVQACSRLEINKQALLWRTETSITMWLSRSKTDIGYFSWFSILVASVLYQHCKKTDPNCVRFDRMGEGGVFKSWYHVETAQTQGQVTDAQTSCDIPVSILRQSNRYSFTTAKHHPTAVEILPVDKGDAALSFCQIWFSKERVVLRWLALTFGLRGSGGVTLISIHFSSPLLSVLFRINWLVCHEVTQSSSCKISFKFHRLGSMCSENLPLHRCHDFPACCSSPTVLPLWWEQAASSMVLLWANCLNMSFSTWETTGVNI